MSPENVRRIQLSLAGVVCAFAALFFAVYAFDILKPPRDINELLTATRTPTSRFPAQATAQTPAVSPTPLLAVEPSPTPIPALYTAKFAGEWPSSERGTFTNGAYQITAVSTVPYVLVPAPGLDTSQLDAFTLSLDGSALGSAPAEYGIFFAHSIDRQVREQFIAFTVTPRGGYRLRAFTWAGAAQGAKTGRWVDLVPETADSHVNRGVQSNRLALTIRGTLSTATINGAKVFEKAIPEIEQYTRRSGADYAAGLILVPAGTRTAQARFTRFQVLPATEEP